MTDKAAERPDHYGAAAIRTSFMHFVFGKGVSASATLLVLFILVRQLEVAEFAAYTSLHALVLILGLISSFGVPQALHRYLPELRTRHNNRAMYRMLFAGIVIRACLYALLAVALLLVLVPLAAALKLDNWQSLIPLYLVVGCLRVNAGFISQALESLLWQRDAQYSLAIGGLVRLGGALALLAGDSFDLQRFVWVECVAELTSVVVLFCFISLRWRGDGDRGLGDVAELGANRARYLSFAFWCYLQNLTSVFYGSAPNRLFVAYFMSAEFIAVFGVVDRLIDFARRYEPLHMFVGLVRPVLMSRFSRSGDFAQLVRLGNLVLFVNFILLFAPLTVLLVSGDEWLQWVTEGKFGALSWLTIAFYVVLLVTSVNNLLDLLVKAVEHNRVYIFSNMLLSGSLLLAIPLIPLLGLWALAVANLAGLFAALFVVGRYLAARGFHYHFEWRHLFAVSGCCVAAGLVGTLAGFAGAHFVVTTLLALCVYGLLVVYAMPIRDSEKHSLLEVLPPRVRGLAARVAG